jgi:DNA-binding transcriptional MerR regulator
MFSIGQLSAKTGVKIPTIRYYEQMGLIENAGRTTGNQRRYDQAGLERLSFIRHARDLGLSIEDIRELVELSRHPDQPCTRAHALAGHHLQSVRARISKLKMLEKELARIATLPDEGHVGSCNVIHALADHSLCKGNH